MDTKMTFKTGFKFGLGFVCASAVVKTTGTVAAILMARVVHKNKEEIVNRANNRVEKFIYGPDGPPAPRPRGYTPQPYRSPVPKDN